MSDDSDEEETIDPPTIELTPEHELEEQEPYERRSDEEVSEKLQQIFEEHYSEETKQWVRNSMDCDRTPPDLGEAEPSVDYETIDDELFEAIQKTSWWATTNYTGDNLQEAPTIRWSEDVAPERLADVIEFIIDDANLMRYWSSLGDLSHSDTKEIATILSEQPTSKEDWSLKSIVVELQQALNVERETAVDLAAYTILTVLNKTRERAHVDIDTTDDYAFRWVVPEGHQQHAVCETIRDDIDAQGGAVTLPRLRYVLRQSVSEYDESEEENGTPRWIDYYQPHQRCLSTFVRDATTHSERSSCRHSRWS